MQKVAIFLDYANLDASARDLGAQVDTGSLLEYLADQDEGRMAIIANAYVPIDPRQEHAMDQRIAQLWSEGYMVKSKIGTVAGHGYKCDFDVEMTLDMANVVATLKPDIVVLVSGDSDFVPVVLDMRSKGTWVEVASFRNSLSRLLRERCSSFIDLNALIEDVPVQAPEAKEYGDEEEGVETASEDDGDWRDEADPVFEETPRPNGSPLPCSWN